MEVRRAGATEARGQVRGRVQRGRVPGVGMTLERLPVDGLSNFWCCSEVCLEDCGTIL